MANVTNMANITTIYKVSHIVNNSVKTIYVFIGKPHIEGKQKQLDKLFQENPEQDVFKGVFSEEELADIEENNIKVKFVPDRIHLDDTIEVIKKKILLHLSVLNASFDELYLFLRQIEIFDAISLYQNLIHLSAAENIYYYISPYLN